jgi:hypothetical protein
MQMRVRGSIVICLMALIAATVARSGHELPVYPSYYPHEIRIETIARDSAASRLREGALHAYVGAEPRISGAPADTLRPIESLGSFVVVRLNPSAALAQDEYSACAVVRAVTRAIAAHSGGLILHPYPVTPFHGDYIHHADLAEAAKARLLADAAAGPIMHLRIKAAAEPAKSLVPAEWHAEGPEWDGEIVAVAAAELIASATVAINGWLGPPWLKTGWFHAQLLLGGFSDERPETRRAEDDLRRLEGGAYESAVERINLERDLVRALTAGCRAAVAGYTVKREYINAEFSAGIENIGFDALAGLNSPMFVRTVKLKDFPWNGWLALGLDASPVAAWNPVAGFTDEFGRLLWSAVGDPALLPSPYGADWMLNRASDVQSTGRR